MSTDLPRYLTTRELADLLRVKERKVYELAASGDIPCSRATGKLLFPRDEIEAWLTRHRAGPGSTTSSVRPNVFAGSHDPLLEWALRESRSGLAAFLDGSFDGLERLHRGEAIAAGVHIVEPEAGDWNRAHVEESLGGESVVLLEWAWREQGLILPSGNPREIHCFADLKGRRFIPRQPEAGTYVLFQILLDREGVSASDLELVAPPARTQTDIAAAVADGKADAGLGLACVARQFRLEFIPLTRERFDIIVYRRPYFDAPFQRLMDFCRSPAFSTRANELGGYDVSGFGRVHYNGP
jgi:putative molybdopterin biosynthesis protein